MGWTAELTEEEKREIREADAQMEREEARRKRGWKEARRKKEESLGRRRRRALRAAVFYGHEIERLRAQGCAVICRAAKEQGRRSAPCLRLAPWAAQMEVDVLETFYPDGEGGFFYRSCPPREGGPARGRRWCEARRMPREAVRMRVRVLSVRARRLHDKAAPEPKWLWNRRSKMQSYKWDADPWIWEVEVALIGCA